MKPIQQIIILSLLIITLVSCLSNEPKPTETSKVDVEEPIDISVEDTLSLDTNYFEGDYSIGDSTITVTPIKMAFEILTSHGHYEYYFYEDKENEDVIYTNESNSKKIVMKLGHELGSLIFEDKQIQIRRI